MPFRLAAAVLLLSVAAVHADDDAPRGPVNLPGGVKLEAVDFERHVMAVVGKVGCNGGSCHGSFQGRGDLRLSLFGFDFDMDHTAFVDLVDTDDPEASYLLEKATLATEHGGGRRFPKDSWQYNVFHEWIAGGAVRTPGSGDVATLEVTPAAVRFRGPDETRQVRVLATFADGSTEDVTAFCDFRVGDDYVVEYGEGGVLRSIHPGDTSLAVQYRGVVKAAAVLVPNPVQRTFVFPKVADRNPVDAAIVAKLRQLNLVPSDDATDAEFLRRVTIDTIGSLPSPEEVRRFVADPNPLKRRKKIDELLDHPLHAALWATKLSDITGNDTERLEQPREKRSRMWHDWFRARIERNTPWDEIARGVLVADSREGRPVEDWIREATAIEDAALGSFTTDYAQRDTLDLFWQRRNIDQETLGEQVAAAFLGVRLQCAKCHKHPYDRWSQKDYRAFATIFGQVRNGASEEAKTAIDAENERRESISDDNRKLPELREVFVAADGRRLRDPKTNQPLAPKALAGPEFTEDADWRAGFVEWMRDPANPFFARAFVNRVWAHYLGKGIVDPVDDFSIGNPPSNPELLDVLAEEFVAHGYDIRHLERMILTSRTYQQSAFPNEFNRHDRRNFARSYPRRMMAEAVVDVLNAALGAEQRFPNDAPEGSRAIEVAATNVRDGNLRFALRVFGRSNRKSACDCDGSTDPSLSQTLYLMTDDQVMRRIRGGRLRTLLETDDRGRRVRDGSISHEDLGAILDEMSLAVLTRYPTSAERRRAIEHVERSEDGIEALVDVVWAMINSREFLLIH